MDEKKPIKVSLSTFFLILAIVVIIVMGFFMYKLYNEKVAATQKVDNLNNEIDTLENTVNNFQEKIDSISNTINSNTSNSTISSESATNNTSNEVQSVNLQLGEYSVTGIEVTPDPESYGISSVTLTENNKFSVNIPLGTSYIGTYKIQDNNLICDATEETNVEGGSLTSDNTNLTFEFEIISKNQIKFSSVNNANLKLTIGMIYSIK